LASNRQLDPVALARILRAELEDGCRDRIVAGGLGAMLKNQLGGHLATTLAPLVDYSRLSPEQRRAGLQTTLQGLPREGAEPSRAPRKPNRRRTQIRLTDPVSQLPRANPKQVAALSERAINSCSELLQSYPRDYEDRRTFHKIAALPQEGAIALLADVVRISTGRPRRGLSVTTATLSDGSGRIQATWFNQPYMADTLRGRSGVAFFGAIRQGKLNSPEYELNPEGSPNAGRIVPIYSQVPGITQKQRRAWSTRIIGDALPELPEPLPPAVLAGTGLPHRRRALADIHFPPDRQAHDRAQMRIDFDVLFYYHLAAAARRRRWREQSSSRAVKDADPRVDEFVEGLPFRLTAGQSRAKDEILQDLRQPYAMHRLLQGDVGSGKTAVAACALLAAASAGFQGALMAPTQILANQHHRTLLELLDPAGVRVELVTAALTPAERARIWRRVAGGDADVVVGTQALVSEAARFASLNLVIVDEQHRFGVRQRATLRAKGDGNPHTLIMSATPIPRTLAASISSEIDVSLIRELPAGRREIKTILASPRQRQRAYDTLLSEIASGAQAYIVCPLVEASESVPARAVEDEYQRLRDGPLNGLGDGLGLLHGQLPPARKQEQMDAFSAGRTQVLVTTSVIEVGVDVPNATVMMIEGAERFGLAQLHQLRGRVGRGRRESLCLLMSDSQDAGENKRLQAMTETSSGFELAEVDLKLRGPGELLGTRQSGYDPAVIKAWQNPAANDLALEWARKISAEDPELTRREHRLLRQIVRQRKGPRD
jgi:ATP-dependent DNA helicase RecG